MQSVAAAIFEYKSIVALCFVMLSKRLLVDEINHYNSTKKCNKIDCNDLPNRRRSSTSRFLKEELTFIKMQMTINNLH